MALKAGSSLGTKGLCGPGANDMKHGCRLVINEIEINYITNKAVLRPTC